MGAAAAYMMDKMRIRLNSAQLKADTGTELGNNIYPMLYKTNSRHDDYVSHLVPHFKDLVNIIHFTSLHHSMLRLSYCYI